MKLKKLLPLSVFSLSALCFSGMLADRYFGMREMLQERVRTRGSALAESAAALSLTSMRDRTALNQNELEIIARLPDVDYLIISDVDGRSIYTRTPSLERYRKEFPADRLPIHLEIRDDADSYGTVRLGLSLRAANAQLAALVRRGFGIAAGGLVLLALLSWGFGRFLGRQLMRFTEAFERFDVASLPEISPLLKGSEFDRITQAFKRLHERLEEEERQRREVEKLKDDLSNMIVHDLKHPLTVLKMAHSVLREQKDGGAGNADFDVNAMAEKALSRLSAMADDMLQIARMNSAQWTIEKKRVLVGSFFQECFEEHQLLARSRGRRLRSDADPVVSRRHVYVDAAIIRRIIENLVRNALEHSAEGTEVVVGIGADGNDGSRVMFRVHNEGAAISDDRIHTIFDKFVSFGESVRNVGLGLAFCKLAAERHGTRIQVDSSAAEGTTFSFTLPSFSQDAEVTANGTVVEDAP